MDLRAFLDHEITIRPLAREKITTGLSFEIPPGYEGQVRPRSGLALKSGLTVLNSPGTVDSDYRGEVQVILVNFGDEDVKIRDGDRVAQLVISPVCRARLEETCELSFTERGSGAFGSTGQAGQ
jgi:dUTP pyrophosphatase